MFWKIFIWGSALVMIFFLMLFCCLYSSNLSKKSTKILWLILKQSRSRSLESFHEIYLHICTKKKSYDHLDSTFKSRDITLPTKDHLGKAMVFPVVMYGCDSWTIKRAEHRRIDAFELWGWRRLLRVPWTARRSNQSVLKVITPEYSLEGLMLKLKLEYFGHLLQRTDSL